MSISVILFACDDPLETPICDLCTGTSMEDEIFDIEFEGISTNCKGNPVVFNFSYILELDSLVNEDELHLHVLSEGDYLIDSSFIFLIDCGVGDSGNEDFFMTKLLEPLTLKDKGHIYISAKEFNIIFSFDASGCFFAEEIDIATIFERP